VKRTLEIVRQPRIHGTEAFWICPKCASVRMYLFVLKDEIGCRGRDCLHPLGLSYACRTTRNRAALRVARLRRKLGGLPSLLAPLPSRPKHWRRDYWARTLAELVAAEAMLAARLGVMVGRRRKRA
jgi:hypothetical protein